MPIFVEFFKIVCVFNLVNFSWLILKRHSQNILIMNDDGAPHCIHRSGALTLFRVPLFGHGVDASPEGAVDTSCNTLIYRISRLFCRVSPSSVC